MMHLVIRGCCPGQTGHHIFPDAWGKSASCNKYTSGSAPTVCVEGTGRHHGSHKEIHTEMDRLVGIFKENQNNPIPISAGENGKNEDTAVAMAADSFHNSIGEHCDRECTVAQLKHYYENQAKCSGNIRPTEGHESGKGGHDEDSNFI